MKKLYEFAEICIPHQTIVRALLEEKDNAYVWKLYGLLNSGRVLNNTEAMSLVLGKHDVKYFSTIKGRMLEVFIKVISIQDVSNVKSDIRYNRVVESIRQNLAARIILYRGGRGVSMNLLESSLSDSTLEHLNYNVLDQIRLLTIHYGTVNYNKYKLGKFLDLEKEYSLILQNETKALSYYIELKKAQLHSLAEVTPEVIKLASKYSIELAKVKVRSRTFNFYKFQVFVKRFEFNRDFSKLLDLCDSAEIEFSTNELYSVSSITTVRQVRLWTLIQLGRYAECIERGLPELSREELAATNWYSFLHYTLKACLYSGKYEKAEELIFYCLKHKNYKRLNVELKEVADLHLGYVHLINGSGIYKPSSASENELPNFKVGKYLNNTQVFSKDKRGINVSILLMHIAFLLQRKDYNAIIDRTDSLNQYAYRYLRKDDSFRSNCMIKMVIQMTKADFHPVRTARYTADLRKQLSHVTLAGSGENIEVEIIPFEVLWDIMTKAL